MTCELAVSDYPDIRMALGLAGDDTTGLPDAVIETRAHLPRVTRLVAAALEDAGDSCAFSCEETDPDYDEGAAASTIDALVLLAAAQIASGWMGARGESRITSQGLGPLRVSYDKTDWDARAVDLRARGLDALAEACPEAARICAGDVATLDLISLDGPSRICESAATKARRRERELDPWGMGGP